MQARTHPLLDRLTTQESPPKRPKSRRIAELLPDIEAALARGFSRAQIVEALKAQDIDVSASMLSTYLHRLRGRSKGAPLTRRVPAPVTLEIKAESAAGDPAFKFGAHDPRRLDEVMRTPPDMRALAKLAKKGPP